MKKHGRYIVGWKKFGLPFSDGFLSQFTLEKAQTFHYWVVCVSRFTSEEARTFRSRVVCLSRFTFEEARTFRSWVGGLSLPVFRLKKLDVPLLGGRSSDVPLLGGFHSRFFCLKKLGRSIVKWNQRFFSPKEGRLQFYALYAFYYKINH